MSTRKRRPLINVRWYRVRKETQPSLIIGRLHRAIDVGAAVLFYPAEWMEAHRKQTKRLPLLRRFRPLEKKTMKSEETPQTPLETPQSDLPEGLKRVIREARELGFVVILLDKSGRIRFSSVDDLSTLPTTETDTEE